MEKLCDANLLYDGFKRARKGSAWKPEVQLFSYNFLQEITNLQKELINGKYKTSEESSFIIHERGKARLIHGLRMRDRVVRHVFCDHILEPIIRSKLIYDNYASLTDRGIAMARKRFAQYLHKYYRKHGNKGYILMVDFSGYYDNVLHKPIKEMLDYKLTPKERNFLHHVLDKSKIDVSYLPQEEKCEETKFKSLDYYAIPKELKTGKRYWEKSLNIGDQTSQIFGVWYPTRIDNYVKIVRGIKHYGRYMDDLYIIAETKEELHDVLNGIKAEAKKLGIFIHERKTAIYKLNGKFRFLQLQYSLTDSGRLIVKINPKRITAMRRKLKKLKPKVDSGVIPIEDIVNLYHSWIGNYAKYMSKIQRYNMNLLFYELYGGCKCKFTQIMGLRLKKTRNRFCGISKQCVTTRN